MAANKAVKRKRVTSTRSGGDIFLEGLNERREEAAEEATF